jgi:hypothetical protein
MNAGELFLQSLRYRYRAIKKSGDGVLVQVDDSDILWQFNPEANSIAIIVQHLHGNMLSRWTDFFTTDGNKPWRDRDGEFEPRQLTKAEVLTLWENGWECTFRAIDALTEADLTCKVTIRGQELDVIDACLRQFGHYSQHVGQMVHIAKERLGERWQTLSIARGKSREYRPKAKD